MRDVYALQPNPLLSGFASRRAFLSGASATLALSACGGGESPEASPPILLSTAAQSSTLRAVATSAATTSQNEIYPGNNWTGSAGSGFTYPPLDPVRLTAKPTVRLIVPPNQAYTDTLLVGVAAFANDGGSLLENLGLKSLIVYFEGNQIEISSPSSESFTAENGQQVSYFGWWFRLRHDGRNGDAHLFVEAVPRDTTMQNRVMGPYLFMPSSALYDLELTVSPSQPEIAGTRYASIRAALAYAALQRKDRPRITLTEARDDYRLESIGRSYVTAKGYATIEALVPITISNASYAPASPRTFYDGLRFKGSNITIDHKFMDTIYHEGKGCQHWFDGVNITSTAGPNYTIPALRGPKLYSIARNNPWFTECTISSVANMVVGASLARGCRLSNGLGDIMTDVRCAVGNYVENFNSSEVWAKDVPAFTLTYIGNASSANLELSGYSDQASRVFTATVDGMVVGSFTVSKTATSATPCSAVVNWLNGLPGFVATLLDDSRRATFCSLPKLKGGAFGPTNVKGTTLQIVTMLDIHSDVWQQLFGGIRENVIVFNNIIVGHVGQCFFISTNEASMDLAFVNNCYYAKKINDVYAKTQWFFSQVGRSGLKSHLIFSHNSMNQAWWFRTDDGFSIDSYCMFKNNVCLNFEWKGKPANNVPIDNNHFYAMTSRLAASSGTTTGGTEEQIWPRAALGDFTPSGPLLYATSKPSVRRDGRGRERRNADVPGAVAS